ncbi:MAG: (d)CMP kinase [Verrucomicrobiae bacterium]|nr:(d)CMP kinase [Verrucomicrobiae bacterium]
MVIAIDGPSASGKSTVSRLVAESLGFRHVDTGAMYRAVTWKMLDDGVDPADTDGVVHRLKTLRMELDFVSEESGPSALRIRLDDQDPGRKIREAQVERAVSAVAAIPQVRAWCVARQRALASRGDLVMEGRDIGTVVFPETPYKFFLDASPEVRAQRRAAERTAAGENAAVAAVAKDMTERDRLDCSRKVAPLRVADDAIRLDTSRVNARGVADLIIRHLRSRHARAACCPEQK